MVDDYGMQYREDTPFSMSEVGSFGLELYNFCMGHGDVDVVYPTGVEISVED